MQIQPDSNPWVPNIQGCPGIHHSLYKMIINGLSTKLLKDNFISNQPDYADIVRSNIPSNRKKHIHRERETEIETQTETQTERELQKEETRKDNEQEINLAKN